MVDLSVDLVEVVKFNLINFAVFVRICFLHVLAHVAVEGLARHVLSLLICQISQHQLDFLPLHRAVLIDVILFEEGVDNSLELLLVHAKSVF